MNDLFLPKRAVRFGEYDMSNIVNKFDYETSMIADKEENINSTISTVNVMRTGASNGNFTVPERKEKKILPALIEDYDGSTFNKDFHQFPAILTTYNPVTKEVVHVTVFANCTAYKASLNEAEEKKQGKKITYNWSAEDTWDIDTGNYVYVDKLTGTEEKTYKLTRELATATTPILTCMINYETLPDHFYSVEADESGTGYSIVFKNDVEIKAGDKILVVYETDSTVML